MNFEIQTQSLNLLQQNQYQIKYGTWFTYDCYNKNDEIALQQHNYKHKDQIQQINFISSVGICDINSNAQQNGDYYSNYFSQEIKKQTLTTTAITKGSTQIQNFSSQKKECQDYIKQIQIKLKQKTKNIKNSDSIFLIADFINIQKKTMKFSKKHVNTLLSSELGIPKKHLSRLWATKMLQSMKQMSQKQKIINKLEIEKVKSMLFKSCIKISDISNALKSSQWLRNFLQNNFLKDNNPLVQINNSKINDRSKLLMFETYEIFKEAIKNPDGFKSWDIKKKYKIDQSQELYQLCKNKSSEEIQNILQIQISKKMHLYPNNKSSLQNNISYCWFSYLKQLIKQQKFKKQANNSDDYKKIQQNLKYSVSINNINQLLNIKILSNYLYQQKLKNQKIYAQILLNTKINIINKFNMVHSVPDILNAIKNKKPLKNWSH